jgi:RNA recognition motif-containing protein
MSKVPDFTDERSASDVSEGRKEQEFDRHRNQGNILFVGNLPFHTPWQHIKDQFRQAGKVRYTDLIADRSGRPKGSALVTMQTSDGARRAIRQFNEIEFEGRRLIVRLFDDGPRPQLVQRDQMPAYNRRRENQPPAAPQQNQQGGNRAAPVRSVPPNAGMINNNAPKINANNQKAQRTISTDDVDVPKPRSMQANEADRKLFVSNLPFDCSASALRETFQQIGNVDRAEIIVGRSGKSRGMGIVVMGSPEEARVAIAEFDGIEMAGRAMNVRFDQKS